MKARTLQRAFEIFDAVEPHLAEFGASGQRDMLLFRFRNGSQIRIVLDGDQDASL